MKYLNNTMITSWEKAQGFVIDETISTELRECCSVQVCVVSQEPPCCHCPSHGEDIQDASQIHSSHICPLKCVAARKFFLILTVNWPWKGHSHKTTVQIGKRGTDIMDITLAQTAATRKLGGEESRRASGPFHTAQQGKTPKSCLAVWPTWKLLLLKVDCFGKSHWARLPAQYDQYKSFQHQYENHCQAVSCLYYDYSVPLFVF